MAFMELEIESAVGALRVDTPDGTYFVPAGYGDANDINGLRDYAPEGCNTRDPHWPDSVEVFVLDYGYLARLSAPGYLDCTDWVWASSKREAARLAKG